MMKRLLQDKKNLVILLLSALFLIKIPGEGFRFVLWGLGGVFVAVFVDLFINRVFLKKRIIPKSAIITGLIVAGILNYNELWFLVLIFPALAIVSKHIIKYKNRHIFNPANFALFLALIFKLPLTWNIESNIYLIIIIGLYLAYTIKKMPHVLGFLITFSLLFILQGINPLMLISWFFVFIMLIEPKTSGFGLWRGVVFGAIAGTASFIIFRFFPSYDLFISALFIANLFKPILDKIKK